MSNFVGFASAESDTVSIPAHSNGDVLIMMAFRNGSTTAPSTPSGWTSLNGFGQNNMAARIAGRVSDGTVTSVTATNAQVIAVWVFTSPDGSPSWEGIASSFQSGTNLVFAPRTLTDSDGSSWRLFGGAINGTGLTVGEVGSPTVRVEGETTNMTYIFADEANVTTSPQRDYTISPGGTYTRGSYNVEIRLTPVAPPAPVADSLLFTTQPASSNIGTAKPAFVVSIVDSTQGNAVDTTRTDTVTITDTPNDYTGTKSVAAVAGVATFDGLIPEKRGTGVTLTATAAGLTSATSAAFDNTVPSGGTTIFTEEPMLTPVLRNSTDPAKRIVLMRIRNSDNTPWAGSTAGVKPQLNGTPLADDIIRLYGDIHAAQLSQPQSNTTNPYLYVTLPADGARQSASGVGVVSATDVTVGELTLGAIGAEVEGRVGPTLDEIESAIAALPALIVTAAQEDGVELTDAQVAAISRAVFRAMHYADGFGIRRNDAEPPAVELTLPGEVEPTVVPVSTDGNRPTIVEAGAAVS